VADPFYHETTISRLSASHYQGLLVLHDLLLHLTVSTTKVEPSDANIARIFNDGRSSLLRPSDFHNDLSRPARRSRRAACRIHQTPPKPFHKCFSPFDTSFASPCGSGRRKVLSARRRSTAKSAPPPHKHGYHQSGQRHCTVTAVVTPQLLPDRPFRYRRST